MKTEEELVTFTFLMGKLALAFNHEITEPHVALYFERLESCSMYQVSRAIDELIDTGDRFPYLSKVLTLARSFKREPTKPMTDAVQIEEVNPPNDLPRNKDDFFKAMNELNKKVEVS